MLRTQIRWSTYTAMIVAAAGLSGCSAATSGSRQSPNNLSQASVFSSSDSSSGTTEIGGGTESGGSSGGSGQGGGTSNVGGGTESGNGSNPSCSSGNTADVVALASVIAAVDSPAQSLQNCAASLGTAFSASATNANGKVTNVSHPSDSQTEIGVNCTDAAMGWQQNSAKSVALEIDKFEEDGLRTGTSASFFPGGSPTSAAITKTDLCTSGSSPPCTPSSAGFILEIDWNSNAEVASILLNDGTTVTAADLSCAGGANLESPLVIEDRPGRGIVTLNPLSTNTYFDLTGDGSKNRIACVTQGAFLALPNANGQILNIDQLFGNNTVGPDGQKAANGFLALGKYDSNGDGVINAEDPVFEKLVLWEDYNCDGVAQPNEISSLVSRGISSITWSNAISMYEVDPWGDVTEERNSVNLVDNAVSRIFDLWFRSYSN